ncbi:aminopeptidase, partial [Acinetobacter baumannii]
EKQRLLAEAFQPMAHRVDNEIKGIRIHYPTAATAQKANMSTDAFEDFFFDVCSFDYRKMAKASTPLLELMDKTDQVRIVGPGTDLAFS